jgi:hypothetical protein
MSITPPQKPRRRIAGESKPNAAATPSRSPQPARKPKIAAPSSGLPKAPRRSDPPPPTNVARPARAWKPGARFAVPRLANPATLAIIVLTLAALVFAVSGVVAGVLHVRGDDAATMREESSDAAAVAAETIFSYDWNKLKQHMTDSKKLMTPRFGTTFEEVSPALSALAPQRRVQMKATVRDAATIECGSKCVPDRAKVLVFLDVARLADGSDKPTVFGNRIEITMVKRDGDWLVDDVKAL